MPSLATETWWSTFLDAEGRDSEEEAAFLGFLVGQGVPADSSPDALQTAYGAFRTFMEESEQRESADAGPNAEELAAEQARVAIQQRTIPKSRVAAPGVEKPLTAVTRPAETRQPLAEGSPSPSGAAQLAPAGSPEAAVPTEPPPPPTEPPPPSEPESHRARHRGGSGDN